MEEIVPKFIEVQCADDSDQTTMLLNPFSINFISKSNTGAAIININSKNVKIADSYDDIKSQLNSTNESTGISLSNLLYKAINMEEMKGNIDITEEEFVRQYKDLLTPNIKSMHPELNYDDETSAYIAYCMLNHIRWEEDILT